MTPSTTSTTSSEHLPSLTESGRLSGLDALRGIAAIIVVLTHFTSTYFAIYKMQPPAVRVTWGGEAVHLFFIISGFVILMTLDRSKHLIDFAVSRFSRLFPIFWACIWVTFVVVHGGGLWNRATTIPQTIINMTMIPSVFGVPPVDVVYWTLTVEFFFYLIMAAILVLRLRRYLPLIVAAFVIFGLFDHAYNLEILLPRGGYRLQHMLILRYWHLFFFGIVIYELRGKRQWWHTPALLLCAIASVVQHGWQGGITVWGCAALVYAATNYRVPGLSNPILLYLGTISYSLYLVHANVGYVILKCCYHLGAPHILAIVTATTLVIVLASILCFLVERPSNAFLRGKYKNYRAHRTAIQSQS